MVGVALASLSSGFGELSFLGLTHWYGRFSLAAWGSGTGAAGLVGAGAYALATTVFGFGVRGTLAGSAVLPVVMLGAFFGVLPRGILGAEKGRIGAAGQEEPEVDNVEQEQEQEQEQDEVAGGEGEGLLGMGKAGAAPGSTTARTPYLHTLGTNLRRARGLFFP